MSDGEQKLADTSGKFAQVISDGRKVPDLEWVSGRILLSNKRILLVSNAGKRALDLSKVRTVKGNGANQALAQVSGYVSVQVGSDVFLIAPSDVDAFEHRLYGALLDQQVVLVKHPAVEGGVVQDTSWRKARFKLELEDGSVSLATADGQFIEIDLTDVGTVGEDERSVLDTERVVLEVEHTIEGTSVETHISGPRRRVKILLGLLGQYAGGDDVDISLSDAEQQVLMALYSGVSSFQIPDFVGVDIETAEEIFEALAEKGVLDPVRTRREVRLKARGRRVAGEEMESQ